MDKLQWKVTPPEGQLSLQLALLGGFFTGVLRLIILLIAALITGIDGNTFWFVVLALISTGFSVRFK